MYEWICYNNMGEVIVHRVTEFYPDLSDFPTGTVRVDIALPVK